MATKVKVTRYPAPNAAGMISELLYETLTGITAVRRRFYHTMMIIAFFAAFIAFAAGAMLSAYVSNSTGFAASEQQAVQTEPLAPSKTRHESKRSRRNEAERPLQSLDP